MRKGYNNFMSKKNFHPGSQANQNKIREAEEKVAAKEKHDRETLAQYQKEQELFNQKSLVSKESREKLSLNFMYDAPPGFKKSEPKSQTDRLEWKKDGEVSSLTSTEIRLEWKRERPVVDRSKMNLIKRERVEVKREPEFKKRIKKEH